MRTLRAAYRFIAFAACTFGVFPVWLLGDLVLPNKMYWRQFMFGFWAKSFVLLSNMQIEVRGTPPKPPFFLVCNHLSYTDIAALRAVVPAVFVAKSEIESWFMVGRIVGAMGTVFIDRTNRRDIPRAGEKILKRLDEGEGVIVFPEGTSTKGEEVLHFNSSFLEFAAKGNVPVSYAAISYTTPPDEIAASTVACWWEDIGFLEHMWRLLKVREYTAIITFGSEPVSEPDRKVLALELHRLVGESFTPVL